MEDLCAKEHEVAQQEVRKIKELELAQQKVRMLTAQAALARAQAARWTAEARTRWLDRSC